MKSTILGTLLEPPPFFLERGVGTAPATIMVCLQQDGIPSLTSRLADKAPGHVPAFKVCGSKTDGIGTLFDTL